MTSRLAAAGLVLAVAASLAPAGPLAAAADDLILLPRSELISLPTSGSAWTALKGAADAAAGTPNLQDQENRQHPKVALASALVYARTGHSTYRDKAIALINAAVGTEHPIQRNGVLSIGRQLSAYVLAADLTGYRDASYVMWLRELLTKQVGTHGVWQSLEQTVAGPKAAPNNWGGFALASFTAAARYLGDATGVERAWRTFRAWGDAALYPGWSPLDADDLSWACASSAANFAPLNGQCVKSGVSLDGAFVADISRAGPFAWPPGATGVSYTMETWQGLALAAELFHTAGYDAWGANDSQLARAARFVSSYSGWNYSSASYHVPWIVNHRLGLSVPTQPAGYGRGFGFTDWLFGGRTTSSPSAAPTIPPPSLSPSPSIPKTRIAGADRYSTAVAISQTYFAPDVPVAFIAVGTNFPDALAGAAVAGRLGGPILLVKPTSIPAIVRSELKRLRPGRLVILGGTGTLSAGLESELAAAGSSDVTRIGGADRYATAVALSRAYFEAGVPAAFVATGANFPDALAASAVAGMVEAPVLLVPPDSLRPDVVTELRRLAPRHVYVLGGAGVVSARSESDLVALFGRSNVTRLAGADRYATAAAVSRTFFAPDRKVAFVATGANFPDAIAGAAPAARLAGPILLVRDSFVPAGVTDELLRLDPERITILGGTAW